MSSRPKAQQSGRKSAKLNLKRKPKAKAQQGAAKKTQKRTQEKTQEKSQKKTRKKILDQDPALLAFGGRWPIERDILWRPERFKYVHKIIKQDHCVFCQALRTGPGVESLLLGTGQHAMAILNKFPYNAGHVLVLPQRHCGDLVALSSEEFDELQRLVRYTVECLRKSYNCQGLNVGLNLGAAGGAGIPEHLHYHVVPRWSGDANFMPIIGETKVLSETLEQTFDRLVPFYKDLSSLRLQTSSSISV